MATESLTSVAVYRRTIWASLTRVWENVLDWEHLPWLHRSSFSEIKLLDSGAWGWCARVGLRSADLRQEIEVELRIDREKRRYVTRTTAGVGQRSEIRTCLEVLGEQETGIEVEFLLPGVNPEWADSIGTAYTRLYTRLWDEDEAMMMRREAMLSQRDSARGAARMPLALGTLEEVRERLPLLVELGGQSFRVVEVEGTLVAHSTLCPHSLGPLGDAVVEDGCIRCPWHGYRFDLRTGRSCDGRNLRLASAPRVQVDPDGTRVQLIWD